MFILYKSPFRIMIIKMIDPREILFFGEIIEIIKTNLEYEDMCVGRAYTFTSEYIIGRFQTLEDLKEQMYITLL